MTTLNQFASNKPDTVPASTSWYLADLGEARGKQELFTKQSSQRLKALQGESVVPSSKRISEGRIPAGRQKGADQGAIRQSDHEKPK